MTINIKERIDIKRNVPLSIYSLKGGAIYASSDNKFQVKKGKE